MDLTVQFDDDGVTLEKSSPHQAPIHLSPNAWQKLLSLRSILETRDNHGQFCLLEGCQRLDHYTFIFVPESKTCMRLRNDDDNVLMQLDLEEYKYLISHADLQQEVVLGIRVAKEMIENFMLDSFRKKIPVECKTVHESMRAPYAFAYGHFTSAIPPATKFIRHLAEEADKCGFILQQPHDTYKAVLEIHMEMIKHYILNKFACYSQMDY